MENEKTEIIKKKRRRIRWGRMIIFLLVMAGFVLGLAWGAYHTYNAGKDVYLECNAMLEDFEMRRSMQTKLQAAKFAQYTNILLLGIDDGDVANDISGRHADTVIVISVNQQTGFINLLSIPRDTIINIPGRKPADKINQSYYYGGTQLAVRTVEEFLQIPLHHYLVIDMECFQEVIDVLGGIYLYVETDMDYEDPYAGLAIHLKQGYQYLDGAAATQYIRYRGDELGDVGRVQRQQKFFKAIYTAILKIDTVAKVPQLIDIVNRRITTSMALLDTAHVAKSLSSCDPESIKAEMLPGQVVMTDNTSSWSPDQAKIAILLEEMFKNENLTASQEGVVP